jgi:hypothetical protein
VAIQSHPDLRRRSTVTLRGCLIDANRELGVGVGSSDVAIENTVIRSTQPNELRRLGWGIAVQPGDLSAEPSVLSLSRSLLENNRELGLGSSGSEVTLEQTMIRRTTPDAYGVSGMGVHLQDSYETNVPTRALLRQCRIEENHGVGVFVLKSAATLESTLVRSTWPSPRGMFGDGLTVVAAPDAPAHLVAESSHIEDQLRAGVSAFGASIELRRNRGANRCACGNEDERACQVMTTGLTAPSPLDVPPTR